MVELVLTRGPSLIGVGQTYMLICWWYVGRMSWVALAMVRPHCYGMLLVLLAVGPGSLGLLCVPVGVYCAL